MSKINEIQSAIRWLSAGAYQKLMDAYLSKRFGFNNITPLGSHTGTDKTTKGTPDSYVYTDSGKFILIAYGTVSEEPYTKIDKDILSCLDEQKTGIKIQDIKQIICCHTSTNIKPGDYKKLHSNFPNTILIGIGELSFDLSIKYPALSKDHLSINLDTHQIFDKNDYIEYASRNAYSTPLDMPLLCRDNEVEELKALLDKEQVIMICGKSGTGKTRLALEIAEAYGKSNNYHIKIIKSNSEPIYEDLQITFTDDKDFLVLVDDADQLVHLKHLLDLCVADNRKYRMKILMTVRDYAKESLVQTVRTVIRPAIYLLEPLDDKSIQLVLKNNLGIKNDTYIKQIQQISKGNVRLAIMAGKCAIKGSFESIKNSFDIFDYYFSDIVSTLDKKEILTATLIALFDSFVLNNEAKAVELAFQQKIHFDEFVEICEALHKKEVVSIFNNMAVKFENQNLRDYLLYYVFFKTKWLTPSYIILNAFPQYTHRIVYAFNTLIKLFNTSENLKYIENEVKKAWIEIKVQSNGTVFQFVKVFHSIIPDEALLTIKREIDNLNEVHINFSTYDFEKTSNNHSIHSEIIELLGRFKYSDRFVEAIKLAFYYLEKNTEYPMDFYFLFSEVLGFDPESYKFSYSQERLLIEQLIEYYEKKETPESALCLTFCISNCLKYEFDATESNRDDSITFLHFGLLDCKEVFEIRSLCFKALSLIFSNENYRQFAIKALLNYSDHFILDKKNIAVLEQDINAFSCCFTELLNTKNFEHCIILYHFYTICKRRSIDQSEILLKFKENNIFVLYITIKKDNTIRKNWEEAERERELKIYSICQQTTNEEFDSFWATLEHYHDSKNTWDVSMGVSIVFKALEDKPKRYMIVLNSYIKHGSPLGNFLSNVPIKLIEFLGYDGALKYINSFEFDNKEKWLSNIYDNIPDSKIDDNIAALFLEKLTEQKDREVVYTLSLSTVLKINSLYPEYIVKYLKTMNVSCKKNTLAISEFINPIAMRDDGYSKEFVDCFINHMGILEEAYLLAIDGEDFYDYHGKLLMQIVQKDIKFIPNIVKKVLEGRRYNDDIRLDIFWDQDNYDELITVSMESIRAELKPYYYSNSFGERLLAHEQDKIERWKKQDKWINDYIIKNNANMDLIEFIFHILCSLSDDQRKSSILLFCKTNSSYSDFKKIPLLSNGFSWSGSEVPILEKRISFLEGLKNDLLGFDYVEHRAYIDEYIQSIRKDIEAVLLREFIEAR